MSLDNEFKGKSFKGNQYESDFYQFVNTHNFKVFNGFLSKSDLHYEMFLRI